jgi:cold shock CspA family protein
MSDFSAGVLDFFNPSRQYGWILADNGEKFFAPQNNFLATSLRPQAGFRVSFIAGRNSKGLIACQIEILVPGDAK